MEEPPKHPAVAALFTELLAATNLNAAGLAKKLDITPQAISNYVVGRNEPGRKMMAAIIKAFPAINAVWLATGEGEPFPNGVHGRPAPAKALPIPVAPAPAVAEAEPMAYGDAVELAVANARIADRDETIRQQQFKIDELNRELGKPFNGLDAAGPIVPSSPRNPIGFGAHKAQLALSVSRRVKSPGAARPL